MPAGSRHKQPLLHHQHRFARKAVTRLLLAGLLLPFSGCFQGGLLNRSDEEQPGPILEKIEDVGRILRHTNEQATYHMLFWDGGADEPVKGKIIGGSGTWNADGKNWTNDDATETLAWSQASGGIAVFGGSGSGTVQIGAPQQASWVSFRTAGYRLEGAPLIMKTAEPTPDEGYAGFGITQGSAVIAADIKQASEELQIPLEVRIVGKTIIFSGDKSYDGQTRIRSNSKLVLGDQASGTAASVRSSIRFDSGQPTLEVYVPASMAFTNVLSSEDSTAQFLVRCSSPPDTAAAPTRLNLVSNSTSFSGTTSSDGCDLRISGNLGGDININTPGAVLSGTGTAGGSGRTVSIVGATLAPGNFDSNEHGKLTVPGNLSLSGTPQKPAISAFNLFDEAATNNDSVRVGGNLTIANTDLQIKGGEPGSYALFSYADSYNGSADIFSHIEGSTDFEYEAFNDESSKTIILEIKQKTVAPAK